MVCRKDGREGERERETICVRFLNQYCVCTCFARARWISMEQNRGKWDLTKMREKVRSVGSDTELLMIVTYMGVWLSLATRHDVTPG